MASTIYVTGFESGVLSANGTGLWNTVNGSPTLATDPVHSGTYSLHLNPSGASQYINKSFVVNQSTVVVRFYFRFATLPSADCRFFGMYASTGGNLYVGFEQATSKVTCYFSGGGTVQKSSATISAGVWNRVDFRVIVSTNPRTCDWQLNGTDQTQVSYAIATSTNGSFGIGQDTTQTYDIYIDDVAISATSGDYPLGPGGTEGLIPTSDGTHNAGTNCIEAQDGTDIGTTTAYDKVNSIPMSVNTYYIRQAPVGATNYAEVNFADISASHTAVLGSTAILAYTSAATQANSAGCIISDNGFSGYTTLWGEPGTPSDYSDGSTTNLYYKSVNIVGANTDALVNALQARMGYAEDATPDPYWVNLMVEVAYTKADAATHNMTATLASTSSLTGVGKITCNMTVTLSATSSLTATGNIQQVYNMTATLASTSALTAVYQKEIRLSLSSYIPAGGGTATTYQLTPPAGKSNSDFSAGYISDDTNPLASLDLLSGKYTELEWCIKGTESAGTDSWEFRVTKNGTVLDTYSVTPVLAISHGTTHNMTATLASTSILTVLAWIQISKAFADSTGITMSLANVEGYNRTMSNTVDITSTFAKIAEYFKSLLETVGITSALSKAVGIVVGLANTLGITDVLSAAIQKFVNLANTVGITDALAAAVGFYRNLADSESITDALSKIGTYIRGLADTIGITDLISNSIGRIVNLANTVGITDVMSRALDVVISLANTLGITTTLSGILTIVANLADTLGITDALSNIRALYRNLADSEGITDALSKIFTGVVQFLETVNITSSLTKVGTYLKSFADTVGITDTLDALIAIFLSLSDSVGITSVLSKVGAFYRTFTDTAAITDTLSKSIGFVKNLVDTESITDALTKSVGRIVNLANTVGITTVLEAIKLTNQVIVDLADTLGITSTLARVAGFFRTISNTIDITTVFSKIGDYIRSIANTADITSTLSKSVNKVVSLAATLSVADSLSYFVGKVVSFAENVGITSTLNTARGLVVGILNTVSITSILSSVSTFIRTLTDSENITSSLSKAAQYIKTISDTLSPAGILTAVKTLYASLLDTVGISDLISNIKQHVDILLKIYAGVRDSAAEHITMRIKSSSVVTRIKAFNSRLRDR